MRKKSTRPSDSLELLLDTMCNTFGGIIFIAISLIIISTLITKTQKQLDPEENDRKRIEELKPEIEHTIQKITSLRRQLAEQPLPDSSASEVKKSLYVQLKQLQGQYLLRQDPLEAKLRQAQVITTQLKQLQNQELQTRIEQAKRQNTVEQEWERQQNKQTQLIRQIALLKEQQSQSRPRQIRFARMEKTSLLPYWVILENHSLYRCGLPGSVSSDDIELRSLLGGKAFRMVPAKGTLLGDSPLAELDYLFSSINPKQYFISLLVNPDSFNTLIVVKQYLREKGYLVNWHITPRYLVIKVKDVTYRASN